jgi:hypothetical protein
MPKAKSFSDKLRTEAARKASSDSVGSVEAALATLNYSFNKGDNLRVSNSLLAAGRAADIASRRIFVEDLANWGHTLKKGLTAAETKNFVLEREHDKQRLEARMARIQSTAESGYMPREAISELLRELADEVDSGEYSVLLVPTPTQEEINEARERTAEKVDEALNSLGK